MKHYIHYLFSGLFIFLITSSACGGCSGCDDDYTNDLGNHDFGARPDSPSFHDPDLSVEECALRCFEAKKDRTVLNSCKTECEEEREASGLSIDICPQHCEKVVQQFDGFVQRECQSLCFDDEDRDGVSNAVDRCPGSEDDRVNWQGCIDSDLDGIPDKDDACKGSKKDEHVNMKGCSFVPLCEEGDCSTAGPRCTTKEECDRRTERPLTRQIDEETRKKWILREIGKRASPLACPLEKSAPGQPVLITPPQAINRVEIDKVRLTFQNNVIIDGPKHTLNFSWDPIDDACLPLTYAVLIESYHCHHVAGLVEPVSYTNRGWCRWEPVTYASNITDTKFRYEFEIGKHLFDIHKAFEAELRFSPPSDGLFEMSYQPFWLRTRVLSIDGNGSPSASGAHSDHRYFVFYDPLRTNSIQLVNIPIAQ